MKTLVVNINRSRCDVYIGRGGPFGNPHPIEKDCDREEALRLFRIYFEARLKMDPAWKAQVMALQGKTLGCHCVPKPCHGNIIAEFLDKTAI